MITSMGRKNRNYPHKMIWRRGKISQYFKKGDNTLKARSTIDTLFQDVSILIFTPVLQLISTLNNSKALFVSDLLVGRWDAGNFT